MSQLKWDHSQFNLLQVVQIEQNECGTNLLCRRLRFWINDEFGDPPISTKVLYGSGFKYGRINVSLLTQNYRVYLTYSTTCSYWKVIFWLTGCCIGQMLIPQFWTYIIYVEICRSKCHRKMMLIRFHQSLTRSEINKPEFSF